MMRAKPANAMQKTYDDCYLVCSTAVYFESQNNEDEALRSWKNALDQIYYHNAYRMPSNYSPKSETEKALFESLRSMELQCKERVDLLEALKSSREEASMASEDIQDTEPGKEGYAEIATAIRKGESLFICDESIAEPTKTKWICGVGGKSGMDLYQRKSRGKQRTCASYYNSKAGTNTASGQVSQTRNKIASQDAIDTARRKHGLGRPSRSPCRFSRPGQERDNFSDEYASPRPNETRRMKSNRGSSENENPRSPPTPPAPRVSRRPLPGSSTTRGTAAGSSGKPSKPRRSDDLSSSSTDERSRRRRPEPLTPRIPVPVDKSSSPVQTSDDEKGGTVDPAEKARQSRIDALMKKVPKGVDEAAAKQIFNEIVVQGDEVHWDDIAGLDIAKDALKETVVYPFLRPDLFMGLREPARGMLLFGPPGTGKTMLARAVATESKSTFFAISASSLTSKFLGESEKLVRALFGIAKAMAPSIIFVDEIDSLLSARGDSGEHEATRRIKTEFLIQWSDLARAAAGREQSAQEKERGDASRVLVLAATNLPWAIDEAARRRFVRRQYIPLPEDEVRKRQLKTLLGAQKHGLSGRDIEKLVALTDGFSGSDVTYLAKDAAMGPLRSLGDKLLNMTMEDIRPIEMKDFMASLKTIRPSVSKQGIEKFEDWAREFGERGG
ncbi:hypothetical protein BLS_004538 [Venturia inaequalis]|uniref:AAA+ ATPase domain-containing protein n=1 Tax=Venturia inaequalis TaxID=5025 RepID=A0A8H3VDU9_VENIN|nr:hypothetical protein BLS_004538 [Venturia inaequalis]